MATVAVHVNGMARRILAVDWTGRDNRTRSRGYLMKEYLRRAAWWATATHSEHQWPFFDIAAAVDPSVRAAPDVVERVESHLKGKLQGVPVTRACVRALHFAALLDAGVALPHAPSHPFEPLLLMFERGGGFHVEGGGLIDVDTLGIRAGKIEDNLVPDPIVQLDDISLNALDT